MITLPHNIQLNAAAIDSIRDYKKSSEKTDLNSKKIITGGRNYDDPLNKWPVRGLAYTNELGAALSEIAPVLGILLWIPALLYFGADIYDKYKNDKTSFDPDSKRGTKQAVFQLLASVLLPTGSVMLGQKIASKLGVFRKKGISLQEEENLANFTLRFIERRNLNDYKNNREQFKNEYFTSLFNKLNDDSRKRKLTNPVRKLTDKIASMYSDDSNSCIASFFKKYSSPVRKAAKRKKLEPLAQKLINKIFELEENLYNNKKPKEFSNKMFAKFQKAKEILKRDPEFSANHIEYAIKDSIKAFEHAKIFKQKMLKTIGGFAALGLAVKPIDNFVEHVIIQKFVEPGLMMIDDHNFRKKLDN